jgi:hypothetical protein
MLLGLREQLQSKLETSETGWIIRISFEPEFFYADRFHDEKRMSSYKWADA